MDRTARDIIRWMLTMITLQAILEVELISLFIRQGR